MYAEGNSFPTLSKPKALIDRIAVGEAARVDHTLLELDVSFGIACLSIFTYRNSIPFDSIASYKYLNARLAKHLGLQSDNIEYMRVHLANGE